jgi:RNA-binding protein
MVQLNSAQRKELRSKAHHLEPVVIIGNNGVTETVIDSVDKALEARELIKIRFNEFKKEKKTLSEEIAEKTESGVAGVIGHVAILYRPNKNEDKRKIKLKSS